MPSLSLVVVCAPQLRTMTGVRGSRHCATYCGSAGCQCQPVQLPLSQVDHILFLDTKHQRIIGCLCGDLQVSNKKLPALEFNDTKFLTVEFVLSIQVEPSKNWLEGK